MELTPSASRLDVHRCRLDHRGDAAAEQPPTTFGLVVPSVRFFDPGSSELRIGAATGPFS